ncbi:hypothetical protein E2C01_068684 [Portunus trituberculatus]|uniref:Uncharacterized protein n=1 Tax=Portunus trituberculatus TaxID=210409 RepID=A0A5B7HYJ8_PORTR|nr:hypothetical protein [Portunus trituberculatus]
MAAAAVVRQAAAGGGGDAVLWQGVLSACLRSPSASQPPTHAPDTPATITDRDTPEAGGWGRGMDTKTFKNTDLYDKPAPPPLPDTEPCRQRASREGHLDIQRHRDGEESHVGRRLTHFRKHAQAAGIRQAHRHKTDHARIMTMDNTLPRTPKTERMCGGEKEVEEEEEGRGGCWEGRLVRGGKEEGGRKGYCSGENDVITLIHYSMRRLREREHKRNQFNSLNIKETPLIAYYFEIREGKYKA